MVLVINMKVTHATSARSPGKLAIGHPKETPRGPNNLAPPVLRGRGGLLFPLFSLLSLDQKATRLEV